MKDVKSGHTEKDMAAVNPVKRQAYIETASVCLLSTSLPSSALTLVISPSFCCNFGESETACNFGEDGRVSSPGDRVNGLVVGSRLVDAILTSTAAY